MEIILNTDNNMSGTEEMRAFHKANIANALERYNGHLTRIEVKISDEDGSKNSGNDKRCVIEVRPKGLQPIAVTGRGDSVKKAVDEAINKIKSSLDTVRGQLKSY
jgi:ribosomal subunit interface protein